MQPVCSHPLPFYQFLHERRDPYFISLNNMKSRCPEELRLPHPCGAWGGLGSLGWGKPAQTALQLFELDFKA